jgi:putative membrane protein (TIGR04086 family)
MKNIRWGWIVLGGVLAELAIFVVVVPLILLVGQQSLNYCVPPASFIATFAFGLWVANKAPQRPLLHGVLVGVVAMLILLAMMIGRPQSTAYVVAHVLKVLGGAAGGLLAMKRASNSVSDARAIR